MVVWVRQQEKLFMGKKKTHRNRLPGKGLESLPLKVFKSGMEEDTVGNISQGL